MSLILLHFLCRFCLLAVTFANNTSSRIGHSTGLDAFAGSNSHTPLRWHPNSQLTQWDIRQRGKRSMTSQPPTDHHQQHMPPRILPDLPPLLRFFDRTGMQVRCRATGNPTPKVEWYVLSTAMVDNRAEVTERLFPEVGSSNVGEEDLRNLQMDAEDLAASDLSSFDQSQLDLQSRSSSSSSGGDTGSAGDGSSPASGSSSSSSSSAAPGGTDSNLFVAGDGWLNVTAARASSTQRRVFFCQAENYLGQARSRKVIIHQVPMPDKNLRIVYHTFPVAPNQKAVISCETDPNIFTRFFRIKYWEVFYNGSLISTVYDSSGRFSVINATTPPELHIRSVTEKEITNLEVRCILLSIVNETVVLERPERGRLQRLNIRIDGELRSLGGKITVSRGSTVELPWSVEGVHPVAVQWYFKTKASGPHQAIPPTLPLPPADGITDPSVGNSTVGAKKYQLVDGGYDNLRLVNLSVADSGFYVAESVQLARRLYTTYSVLVTAPLGAKISPRQSTVDWGQRVELTCLFTGHPITSTYWMHNGMPRSRRHQVLRHPSSPVSNSSSIREQLVIEAFTLDDVGTYQCLVENSHSLASSPLGEPAGGPQETTSPDALGDAPDSHRKPPTVSPRLSASDIADNAQATGLLTMGKMRPSLTWQKPDVEAPSTGLPGAASTMARVLLSIQSSKAKTSSQSRVELVCGFAANPVPQVTWYRDDEQIPLDLSGVLSPETGPDPNSAYTTQARLAINIRKVFNLDDLWTFGGEYRAVANNTHGDADCRTYVLLETTLRIRSVQVPNPAIVGRTSTLKCLVIGNGIPIIQWHRIKTGVDVQRIPVDHRHQLFEGGRVLRIVDVTKEEDEAEYRCTASLGEMKANRTVSLTVSHAPRLIELPATLEMKYARDVLSYNCALRDRADQPWYAWWEFQRQGTNSIISLPPSKGETYNGLSVSYVKDTAFQNDSRSWHLPDSLRDKVPQFVHYEPNAAVLVTANEPRRELHQGNLTCVVLNEVGEDRRSIRVTFIPELEFAIRPPNNQDVILGENIAIDCTAKSSDLEPIVDWQFYNKTVRGHVSVSQLTSATGGRIYQLANGTLVLKSVSESDPREFLCFLKPASDSSSAAEPKSVVVNLEVHAPARLDPIANVEKVRGSRFNLTCSVHGDAVELKATWFYRRPPETHWLLIDRPCVRSESELDSSATGFERDPANETGFSTEAERFSTLTGCQSFGMEGQDTKVLFRQTSVFKPNKRGLDRHLEFLNVKEIHMGEYMCRASNLYNRDANGRQTEVEARTLLTVISVPDPVTFIHNSSRTTATTVSFAWQPPLRDGNKPIKKYRIRYSHSEPGGLMESRVKQQQPNISEKNVLGSQHGIQLTDLRPYTKYHIIVTAINDVGSSTENSLALTTQEAKPGGPVRQLTANGTASDTIAVSWDNPAPELLNGNVDQYWVCLQRVNTSSLTTTELVNLRWPQDLGEEGVSTAGGGGSQGSSSVAMPTGQIGPDRNQRQCVTLHRQRYYEISGLPKFTAYAIRVVAMNSKGVSPPAYTQARTLEDLPQAAPSDVTCASQQHSITVSWNPPDPETINGILIEYHVSYFADNVYGDETSSVNQAVEGQTTVTLAGLLAYTNYTVQVAVSNRKGRGPSSPRLLCLTMETLPEAPVAVKARPMNSTCLVVSWRHPEKPNGRTRKYCLEAIPVGVSISNTVGGDYRAKKVCTPPRLSQSWNYYLYCGLTEYQAHNVSVWAVNLFEGTRAWTGPVVPTIDPPSSIISIGGKIVTQNKMRVAMDCLVIGGYPPHWTYPNDHMDGRRLMENGTLLIDTTELAHSGRYTCSTDRDNITYDLAVQEILEEPPRRPIWHKFTPSLRGIQAEWLSPGSRRLDAPILCFHLNWTNLYTGERDAVRLPADQRTFYLSSLTCSVTVNFQLAAENKVGNSSLTDVTSWTTLGSAPKTANAAKLIPDQLRQSTWVVMNLSTFLPGNQCPPLFYQIRISPAEDGHFRLKAPVLNLTITRADLITIDLNSRERCCFNVTKLNSGAHYHYEVKATNAAGYTTLQGQFWTLTVSGTEPTVQQRHLLGPASLFQRPTIIVPIAALLAFLIISMVAILLVCRHRRLELALASTSPRGLPVGNKQEDLAREELLQRSGANYASNRNVGAGGGPVYAQHQHGYYRQQRHNDLRSTGLTSTTGNYRVQGGYSGATSGGGLVVPGSQASTALIQGRTGEEGTSGARRSGGGGGAVSRWLSSLIDRKRSGTSNQRRQTSQDRSKRSASQSRGDFQYPSGAGENDDRLSNNSIDSEGNINPYATYAASGFPEQSMSSQPVYPLPNGGLQSTEASGQVKSTSQTLAYSRGHHQHQQWLPSPAVVRGLYQGRLPPEGLYAASQQTPSQHHHYHYPNLGSGQASAVDTEILLRGGGESRRQPRLYRVGSAGRLVVHHNPVELGGDPRQQLGQHQARTMMWAGPGRKPAAGLLMPPYDNNTLGTIDSREDDPIELRGVPSRRPRRVNSFDSLTRLVGVVGPDGLRAAQQAGTTYHHGFMLDGHPTQHHMRHDGISFYDVNGLVVGAGGKLDPAVVAYRGSVLSSATTASSNQDELVQAYEYGRRNLPSCLVDDPRIAAGGVPHLLVGARQQTLLLATATTPVGAAVTGTSGGGSSDENTDSGIRQFTQQPPRPEEARHGACEVSLRAGALGSGGRPDLAGQLRPPRQGAPSVVESTNSVADLTDTYASVVDLNGSGYGGLPGPIRVPGDYYYEAAAAGRHPSTSRTSRGGRAGSSGLVRVSSRVRQPLPALPSAAEAKLSESGQRFAPSRQKTAQPVNRSDPAFPIGGSQLRNRLLPTGVGLENSRGHHHLPLVPEVPSAGRAVLSGYALHDSADGSTCETHTLLPHGQTTLTDQNRRVWSGRSGGDDQSGHSQDPPGSEGQGGDREEEEENIYTSEFVLV